jgi:hypothetical protein
MTIYTPRRHDRRANDFYPTPADLADGLLAGLLRAGLKLPTPIHDPCASDWAVARRPRAHGFRQRSLPRRISIRFAARLGTVRRSDSAKDKNMAAIAITVPIRFTVADIARANPSLSESEAFDLAWEAHNIIAAVQASYIAFPPSQAELVARACNENKRLLYADQLAFEEADLIEMLRRTIVGIWPGNERETADLSEWLMERLDDIGGDSLYLQYLRLCDRI